MVSIVERIVFEKISEVFNREVQISYDTDLRNEGLDSVKTIELIVNLEIEFDIEIDDQDLLVENFSTIHKIAILLSGKYGVKQ